MRSVTVSVKGPEARLGDLEGVCWGPSPSNQCDVQGIGDGGMTEDQSLSQFAVLVVPLGNDPNYTKCPRCWMYHAVKDNYDGLCDRCCRVIVDSFPNHESVPHIKASYEAQRVKYSKQKKLEG